MASRKLPALPTATEVTTSDKIYIVDVSDTTESPQGTSKQALISEFPSSGIPLAGTETGAPITGDLQVKDLDGEEFRLKYTDNNAEENGLGFQFTDNLGSVYQSSLYGNGADDSQSIIGVESQIAVFRVVSPSNVPSVASLSLEQFYITLKNSKIASFVNISEPEIGFFNKSESGSAQAAAIADATNATDVITQLNTLLAAMRAYGFIAE